MSTKATENKQAEKLEEKKLTREEAVVELQKLIANKHEEIMHIRNKIRELNMPEVDRLQETKKKIKNSRNGNLKNLKALEIISIDTKIQAIDAQIAKLLNP